MRKLSLYRSGYGAWKYRPDSIKLRWKRIRCILRRITKEYGPPSAIVVHGTSGTWFGAALAMQGYNVIMVRKPGENSHGYSVEGGLGMVDPDRIVFLDDFVSSGDTIKTSLNLLLNYCEGRDEPIVERYMAIALHGTQDDEKPVIYDDNNNVITLPAFGYLDKKDDND